MRTAFSLILIFLFSNGIVTQKLNTHKLDSFLNELEDQKLFMGSVAVMEDGKIVYKKSVGYADCENMVKADSNTKYRIGSISKTFTAALVFKAIEEKKLDLDKSIAAFYPKVKNAEKITVGMLLRHRSGIHNFTNDPNYLKWNTLNKTEAEMQALIESEPSDFEPDSAAEYSNTNYVLLAMILQKVYNTTYTELLNRYIIKPLQLSNTGVGDSIRIDKNEAYSYHLSSRCERSPETHMSITIGAGSIISTPTDLCKFSNALFGGKIVSPKSLELMRTMLDNFGMGLFQIPFYDMTGYGHTGGIDEFTSVFGHFSKGNVSMSYCSNGSRYDNNKISIAMLSMAYDKPYVLPILKEKKVSPEILKTYTGVYHNGDIPLDITVRLEGEQLTAQATNQSAFDLKPVDTDKFSFEKADVIIVFKKGELILTQMGNSFTFKKK